MHSSDRTLLASLGFADADKRDPRHDWACQYLAQPDQVRQLVGAAALQAATRNGSEIVKMWALPEIEVAKGDGSYRRSIGFIDLAIGIETYRDHAAEQLRHRYLGIIVEVKIGLVPIGDAIRQITLYRSHHPDFPPWRGNPPREVEHRNGYRQVPSDEWPFAILATLYEIDREDAVTLASRDILHVQLGPGFDEYIEGRKQFGEKAKSLVL